MKNLLKLLAILTAPQREAVRQWWIGGLWVNHRDKGWIHARWNPGATTICAKCGQAHAPEWIIDDSGGHYHHTLCTITNIRDFTRA